MIRCEPCSWFRKDRPSAGWCKYTGDDRVWELCEEHLAEAELKREKKARPLVAKIHWYDGRQGDDRPKLRVLEGGAANA